MNVDTLNAMNSPEEILQFVDSLGDEIIIQAYKRLRLRKKAEKHQRMLEKTAIDIQQKKAAAAHLDQVMPDITDPKLKAKKQFERGKLFHQLRLLDIRKKEYSAVKLLRLQRRLKYASIDLEVATEYFAAAQGRLQVLTVPETAQQETNNIKTNTQRIDIQLAALLSPAAQPAVGAAKVIALPGKTAYRQLSSRARGQV